MKPLPCLAHADWGWTPLLAGPLGPLKPLEPREPQEPVEPVEPLEPVEPVEPVEPRPRLAQRPWVARHTPLAVGADVHRTARRVERWTWADMQSMQHCLQTCRLQPVQTADCDQRCLVAKPRPGRLVAPRRRLPSPEA